MTSFLSSPLGLTVSAKETFPVDFRGLNDGLVGDNPSDGPVPGEMGGPMDGPLLGKMDGPVLGKMDGKFVGEKHLIPLLSS